MDDGGTHYGPTYYVGADGLTYAYFNGHQDLYGGSYNLAAPVWSSVSGGATVFATIDDGNNPNARILSANGYTGNSQADYDNVNSFLIAKYGDGANFAGYMSGWGGVVSFTPNSLGIMEAEFSANNSTTWINGGDPAVVNSGQSPSFTICELDIGSRTSGLDAVVMSWGEAITWKRTLTQAERYRAQGYIAGTWNRQSLLPTSHPYRNSQPYMELEPGEAVTAGGVIVPAEVLVERRMNGRRRSLVPGWRIAA